MADKPTVSIDNVSQTTLTSGGTATVKYTILNNNDPGLANNPVIVTVNGVNCSGDCSGSFTLAPGASVSRTAKITGPEVADGQSQSITMVINVSIGDGKGGTDSASAQQKFTVQGDAKPQTVRQLSGKVKDSNGKALAAANVAIQDSTGREQAKTTNSDGAYVFTSSDSSPIAIGKIQVGATKDGYKTVLVSVDGGANANITVSTLTLPSLVASASASPSATVSASATPDDDAVTDDPTGATVAPSIAAADPNNAANNSDDSGSMLFIILGGLLVAAGIGAIVLVLMRRKGKEDPDDPDGVDNGGPTPAGAIPPSRGRYNGVDATRVGGAPMGGTANDATMITTAPVLSDAPTMLQRAVPVEDEFPDPYGAPAVTPGNYAGPGGYGTASAAAGAYGAAASQPTGTYGGANQYGAANPAPTRAGGYDDDGYGANSYGQPQAEEAYGAYGANQYNGAEQQRFDEPTGMYRPEPAAGAVGYHGDQGGYDQAGYGDQQGYEAAPGYGQPGYDQGGYRGPADEPAPRGGAYGAPAGGGGYGGAPEQEYPPAGRGGGYQAGGYQGGGYGGGQEQADDQGGYGSWNGGGAAGGGAAGGGAAGGGAAGGGIDSGNGYGPPAGGGGYDPRGGAYGGGAGGAGGAGGGRGYGGDQGGGGYDQRGGGGYGGRPDAGGGYDVPAQGGRGPQGGPGGGGYGAEQGQNGYYGGEQDGAAGRHGGQPPRQQPPPESTRPGQRRSVDWLDD
jgi:hypothetical protein